MKGCWIAELKEKGTSMKGWGIVEWMKGNMDERMKNCRIKGEGKMDERMLNCRMKGEGKMDERMNNVMVFRDW